MYINLITDSRNVFVVMDASCMYSLELSENRKLVSFSYMQLLVN
jgi:hypothetical protein